MDVITNIKNMKKSFKAFVLTIALIGIMVPVGVFAQSVTSSERVAELTKQIQELLQKIEILKKEVEKENSSGTSNDEGYSSSISICEIGQVEKNIKFGDSDARLNNGETIKEVQEFLRSEGYFTYPTSTGYFGSSTKKALDNWKKDNGVDSQSGYISDSVLRKMKDRRCGGYNLNPSLSTKTDKSSYYAGETIKVSLNLTNKSNVTKTYSFTSGCQSVVTAELISPISSAFWAYNSDDGRACTMMFTEVVIEPGTTKTWKEEILIPSSLQISGSIRIKGALLNNDIDFPALKVNLIPSSVSSGPIVTTPNGGESWKIGDTKTISWIGTTNKCAVNAPCIQVMPSYDIKIVPLTVCPSGMACPTFAVLPSTIASNVSQTNYNWKVGILETSNYNAGVSVLKSGSYKIMVCNSGTNTCDESDREFKIYSDEVSKAPVISELTAPTSLYVGNEGTWKVNAYDPNNKSLTYSVDWGDMYVCTALGCSSKSSNLSFAQRSTFTHTYNRAGTYNVIFTVKNESGLSATATATVYVNNDVCVETRCKAY